MTAYHDPGLEPSFCELGRARLRSVHTPRLATFLLGAALAALLGGCSALSHAQELTIAAEAIPQMNPPPAVAAAPSVPGAANAPAAAAPAQGG